MLCTREIQKPLVVKTMMNVTSYLKEYCLIERRCPQRFLRKPNIFGYFSKLDDISGKFFNLTTVEEPARLVLDKRPAGKLWALSHELSGFR